MAGMVFLGGTARQGFHQGGALDDERTEGVGWDAANIGVVGFGASDDAGGCRLQAGPWIGSGDFEGFANRSVVEQLQGNFGQDEGKVGGTRAVEVIHPGAYDAGAVAGNPLDLIACSTQVETPGSAGLLNSALEQGVEDGALWRGWQRHSCGALEGR